MKTSQSPIRSLYLHPSPPPAQPGASSALMLAAQCGLVSTHMDFVGELALGTLKQRATVLEAVQHLPALDMATDVEVLAFIDAHALHGTDVGYVDVQLLAAVLLAPGSTLWTLDKRLHEAATRMSVAMDKLH